MDGCLFKISKDRPRCGSPELRTAKPRASMEPEAIWVVSSMRRRPVQNPRHEQDCRYWKLSSQKLRTVLRKAGFSVRTPYATCRRNRRSAKELKPSERAERCDDETGFVYEMISWPGHLSITVISGYILEVEFLTVSHFDPDETRRTRLCTTTLLRRRLCRGSSWLSREFSKWVGRWA